MLKRGFVPCYIVVTLYEPCTRNGEAREVARAIEQGMVQCNATNPTHPVTVGKSEIGCISAMQWKYVTAV